MLRTSITRSGQLLSVRAFSTTRLVMAAGDTGSGASRATGTVGGDSFTRREAASEEMWIRQEERQKLLALREKLSKQKDHIDALTKEIDDIVKTGGGEQN